MGFFYLLRPLALMRTERRVAFPHLERCGGVLSLETFYFAVFFEILASDVQQPQVTWNPIAPKCERRFLC
ncbi:UNVERIFIED_CONTAM: hypothetical protein K2H54_039120 [Gekko kuhli]